MQELELTWGQVIRIWWAAFWRWLILAKLMIGLNAGVVGIALLAIGRREWVIADWPYRVALLAGYISAAIMALRLALKARYKNFRIVIIAPPEAA